MTRSYDRAPDQARPASCVGDFVPPATGSALITIGATQVICTASVEAGVPRWMSGSGRGWVTAEYGMLPASTGSRKPRDTTRLHPDGRTVEIQRLIGRALRGIVDLQADGRQGRSPHSSSLSALQSCTLPLPRKVRKTPKRTKRPS